MKTRPIGERFQDGDVTLEVKGASGCKGCYYDEYYLCTSNNVLAGRCSSGLRRDRTSVIFEKVEP